MTGLTKLGHAVDVPPSRAARPRGVRSRPGTGAAQESVRGAPPERPGRAHQRRRRGSARHAGRGAPTALAAPHRRADARPRLGRRPSRRARLAGGTAGERPRPRRPDRTPRVGGGRPERRRWSRGLRPLRPLKTERDRARGRTALGPRRSSVTTTCSTRSRRPAPSRRPGARSLHASQAGAAGVPGSPPPREGFPDLPDSALHRMRIQGKRARYAAELRRRPRVRRTAQSARRFIEAARELQDVLGDHQDAVVAVRRLRELARVPADRATPPSSRGG